jgi:phosphoribosyl-ATP pyrophosphohydrolase/phosphoribosyl-AMP cyclohydrolase
MNTFDSNSIDWAKMQNLVPAIVQDAETGVVLMLAYMSPEALAKTLESGWVTFYSRSKQTLWTKGETSGNKMKLVNIMLDCDQDTLLVLVNPLGPACHTGTETCFGESGRGDWAFVAELEQVIRTRKIANPETSYTARLFQEGIKRIAQKVGEEGVEIALAAMGNDQVELTNESADLLFHLLVLLQAKGLKLADVVKVLKARHAK